MAVLQTRPTLSQFISIRLGSGSASELAARMFSRAFTAGSFRRFWYYWNPLYAYALGYFFYAPMRRYIPKPLCLVLAFAASGFFLHDAILWIALAPASPPPHYPIVTVAFIILSLTILITDRLQISLAALSRKMRVACHLCAIFLAFSGSAALMLWLRKA